MFQLFAHGLEEGGKLDARDYFIVLLAVVAVVAAGYIIRSLHKN